MLTMVMATVFALVAGGFLTATRPIERIIARSVRTIWAMWMRCLWVASKERREERKVIWLLSGVIVVRMEALMSMAVLRMGG
jgi:hypothetical protein